MTTIDELRQALDMPVATTEQAVENAIAVYLAAGGQMDAYKEVQAAAKERLGEIMAETGQTKFATQAGRVAVTAPSVSVSYDRKALDALCASDPALAAKLAPHRKEAERPGTMRVSAK